MGHFVPLEWCRAFANPADEPLLARRTCVRPLVEPRLAATIVGFGINFDHRPSAHIPKADGGKRPLGVPALEDKIVQSAVAEVLSAVYQGDFLGFSYGFLPGRNPRTALDALDTAIMSQHVNWGLDADIRSFLDVASYYTFSFF